MPTGMRCEKTYCIDCLDKDYDGQSNPDDVEEWQYVHIEKKCLFPLFFAKYTNSCLSFSFYYRFVFVSINE